MRQLEYLSALAREGHFARAAATCHVSQPALSAALRRLESDLGVQIVRRGRRFGGFTPEGERVVVWAHRMLADRDAMRQDLDRMAGGLTGVLRIGAIPTALTVAPLLTAPFCERHPDTRVTLESLSSRAIVQRLAEFDLDVGMTYIDGEPLGAVRTVPLYEERYLLLTPAGSPLAERDSAGWAEVADEPLCLLPPVMQNRRILDRNFAEAGVTVVPRIEADAVSVLYGHVATHRWSTVVAHGWLHMFGVPDGMRVVPMEPPARSHQIGLVLADRDPVSLLARALLDVAGDVDLRAVLDALRRRHLRPNP
ncbi:LysR family transcriptional regulator [Pseudonocardia sp. MH-G8]|nr:LysR family transcriptional regulator [Pseudonocardia sp. MH-G8]OZM79054.1 LysR family transcriptional regulator [Pseudonocardia sp. MH-G8]